VLGGRKEAVTDCFDIHISIPSQADGFCTFGLFETPEVELEVFVVKVN